METMNQPALTPAYEIPAPLVQIFVSTIGQLPALQLLAQNPPITVMDYLLEVRQVTQAQDAERAQAQKQDKKDA
jgi:hypothetical protein